MDDTKIMGMNGGIFSDHFILWLYTYVNSLLVYTKKNGFTLFIFAALYSRVYTEKINDWIDNRSFASGRQIRTETWKMYSVSIYLYIWEL